MATKHYIPDLMPEDLEDTADYPPVSAPAPASVSTTATIQAQVADTWVMPKLDEAQPPAAATAPAEPVAAAKPAPVPEDLLRPYVEENSKLRAELSAASTDRDELQQQLEQRTAANRELERRLQLEAERLTQLQGEAAQFERRGTELAAELEARTALLRTADAERAELHARFESAQAELTAQAQQRERLAASQSEAERERAHRETALARSQEELTELHRRVAGHCEALQAVEGQRQLYDSMLREREDMIDQADARARAAEARAQEAERLLAQRPPEPEHKPEPDHELPRRIAALEAQLEESRAEARTLAEQLRSEQESAAAMRTELEARSVARTEAVSEPGPEPTPDPGHTAVPVPEVTRLLVRTSGDTGIVHKLGRRTAIGRTPDNDLRIDEDFISRRHAVILASAESAIVEDLNSTNGVFVNGEQVTRRELREGDLLTIGQTSFRYVLKPVTGQD